MIKQIVSKYFGIKSVNKLRLLKWFFLTPFINDKKQILKFYNSEFDLQIIERLLPQLPLTESSVVLDIGANIGAYSHFLCKFIYDDGAKCIGFEPRSDTFNRLKKNISYNNFIAEKIALSNQTGYADIILHASHGLSSLIKSPEFTGFGSERVALITLDAYVEKIKLQSIEFIKIDVEGHELNVLEGGRKTIEKYRPIILCESENRHLVSQGKTITDVFNYIRDFGYKIYAISKTNFNIIPEEKINNSEVRNDSINYYYNYWFLPDIKYEMILKDILSKLNLNTKLK